MVTRELQFKNKNKVVCEIFFWFFASLISLVSSGYSFLLLFCLVVIVVFVLFPCLLCFALEDSVLLWLAWNSQSSPGRS